MSAKLDQRFPWSYDYSPYRIADRRGERELPCFEIVDREGRRVAVTDQDTSRELQEADARLMAAAPKLFQALETLVERECREAESCGLTDDEMTWLQQARRALALAKGGAA